MSSAKLSANSEWLVWARKTAHYKTKDIAKKIDEDPETIRKWEKTGEISYEDLEKLAEEYKRPTTIFFNNNKPKYEKEITDFRTIGSVRKDNITPEIAFEIRKARERRQTLLDLEEESEEYQIPIFPFEKFDSHDINHAPEILRDILKLNRPQMKKNLEYWIGKIESLGILIFEFYGIDPKELRGYALYYDKLPIIGINHREAKNPKKFTLFHELAHIILKKEGISNINDYQLPNEESLCNKIAAETIVPKDMFNNFINDYNCSRFRSSDIKRLSKLFNVSQQVIVRRALTLNHITKNQFKARNEEFNDYINPPTKKLEKNLKTKEPEINEPKNENLESKDIDHNKGLHNKAIIALRKNGNYFTNSLFDAYEDELITDIDLALELGVRLDVMRKMRKMIIGEGLI